MLIFAMDEKHYLSLLEFTWFFSAELCASAGAGPVESCAVLPAWGLCAISELQQLVSANTTSL